MDESWKETDLHWIKAHSHPFRPLRRTEKDGAT